MNFLGTPLLGTLRHTPLGTKTFSVRHNSSTMNFRFVTERSSNVTNGQRGVIELTHFHEFSDKGFMTLAFTLLDFRSLRHPEAHALRHTMLGTKTFHREDL